MSKKWEYWKGVFKNSTLRDKLKFWIVKIKIFTIILNLNSEHPTHSLITIYWEVVSDSILPDGDEVGGLDLCSHTEQCERKKQVNSQINKSLSQ